MLGLSKKIREALHTAIPGSLHYNSIVINMIHNNVFYYNTSHKKINTESSTTHIMKNETNRKKEKPYVINK